MVEVEEFNITVVTAQQRKKQLQEACYP